MSKQYSNPHYRINRRLLLKALGFNPEFSDHKLPIGKAGEWKDVYVQRYFGEPGSTTIYLPRVILKPSGVANRLHAECPECKKVMRFSGLQQHVDSMKCRERRAKLEQKGTFEYRGVKYFYERLPEADTDFGPETRVRITWTDKDGEPNRALWQESASTLKIIEWFKEQIDETEALEAEQAAQAEQAYDEKLHAEPDDEQNAIEKGETMDYAHDKNPIEWGDENR